MKKWVTYNNIVRKKRWLDKNQSPLPDPKANIREKRILLVELLRYNPSQVIEITFNDYCEYICSAAAE